jgi:hypothetical protein
MDDIRSSLNNENIAVDTGDQESQTDSILSSNPIGFSMPEESPENILKSSATSAEQKKQAMEILKQKEQEDQQKVQDHVAEGFQQYAKYRAAIDQHAELVRDMRARGISDGIPAAPNPDQYGLSVTDIAMYSNPKFQQKIAPDVEKKQQEDQKAHEALQNEQDQAMGERIQKQQQNQILGQIAQQDKFSKEMRDAYDNAAKQVDDQQTQIEAIDPDRFWNSKSTGQKILGALAIAFGEIGKKGGSNNALNIINNYIDQDIMAQKVNNDQKLALKQNALKRVQLEIDRIEAMSKDAQRKFEMQQVAANLAQQQEALKQQQIATMAVNNKLFQGKGLDPQEAEMLLNPDQKSRTLATPEGKVVLARSKDAAEKANTALNETVQAKEALKQFKSEAAKLGVFDKINPLSSDRAAVKSSLEALVGKLRVPITGPGVLSPSEYERISKDVLGDPTSLFTTKGLFEARVGALERLLNTAQKATYKQAGVPVQETKADKLRAVLYRQGKKPEVVEQTIDNLKKQDPSFGE